VWLLVRQGNVDRRSGTCTHSSSLLPSAFSIPLCPSPWPSHVSHIVCCACIADVPILSSPDKNNSALENLENVVNCVLDKEFSAHFSC